MSAGAIVAIAIGAALILIAVIALITLLPRMRERRRVKQRERELQQRREAVAEQHRGEADTRARQAEAAEQRARMAEQEARRERAEAELHQQRASAHERGLADHELIEDHEREHFAGTSADTGDGAATTTQRDASTHIGQNGDGDGRTSAYGEGRMAAHEPRREADFQEGQADESRDDDRGGLLGRFRRRSADDRETARRS
jgi:ABC-type multidrug transport system fused ATPase/permease subunit